MALQRCTGDMGVACPPELLAIAHHAPTPLANAAFMHDVCYSVCVRSLLGEYRRRV